MDAERLQVENCLHYLATYKTQCSQTDALLVNNLAEQPSLSAAQVVFGARLARRYAPALEAAGLVVPAEAVIDASLEAEQERAGQESQAGKPPLTIPLKPSRVMLQAGASSSRIVVSFPF